MKEDVPPSFALTIFLTYAFISLFILLSVVGGWSGIAHIFFALLLAFLILLYLLSKIWSVKNSTTVVLVPYKEIYVLLIVQFVMTAFTMSDTGVGNYTLFYKKYFNAIYGQQIFGVLPPESIIFTISAFIYVILLIRIIYCVTNYSRSAIVSTGVGLNTDGNQV